MKPERADFRPERADSRPERAYFRPERVDFSPERADFRPERAGGGRTNERTDGRTDERTNGSPPVFYRTSSPSGPLPKKRKKERKKAGYTATLLASGWAGAVMKLTN